MLRSLEHSKDTKGHLRSYLMQTFNIFAPIWLHQQNDDSPDQSKELTRGPPELLQHFSFIGGVHIGARALHVVKFDMVWLQRSPIPVGRRGVSSLIFT
jgi:hypothetical protein